MISRSANTIGVFSVFKVALIGFGVALSSTWTVAENLGQRGDVSMPDRDGREQLKDRARQIPKAQLDRFWQDYRNKTVDAIINPKSLGIRTDLSVREVQVVPTFRMPFDAIDSQGKVVAKRGSEIRPLDINPLVWGLIFIDGQDPEQVRYAVEQGRRKRLKIVLTAGSPYKLRQQYKNAPWVGNTSSVPFYFDQKKMIITQLQKLYGIDINSVPAQLQMVRQGRINALRVVFGKEKS